VMEILLALADWQLLSVSMARRSAAGPRAAAAVVKTGHKLISNRVP